MDDRLDSPYPTQVEEAAQQLRQWAYLAGEYWRALTAAGIPAHLADDIVRSWHCDVNDIALEDFTDD